MNPLYRLSPALFTALSGLTYAGAAVPIYAYQSTMAPACYILLASPKILEASGRASCRQWLCEVLVVVKTTFAPDKVSVIPANTLADTILSRLDGYRLPLPDRWDCMPGQLANADDEAGDSDQQQALVVRRLRVQWLITYHGPAPTPIPVALSVPYSVPFTVA